MSSRRNRRRRTNVVRPKSPISSRWEEENQDNYIKDNTIIYSSDDDMEDTSTFVATSDHSDFNQEAAILGQETGISYEEAVKLVEENREAEKRKKRLSSNQQTVAVSNNLKSKEWGLLSQQTPEILHIAINIMFEETMKSENNGGNYPTIEYAISLALDRQKDIIKKEGEDFIEQQQKKENNEDNEQERAGNQKFSIENLERNDKEYIRKMRLKAFNKS